MEDATKLARSGGRRLGEATPYTTSQDGVMEMELRWLTMEFQE
jgi:hypothetical protein